jgi:hypothetical protein
MLSAPVQICEQECGSVRGATVVRGIRMGQLAGYICPHSQGRQLFGRRRGLFLQADAAPKWCVFAASHPDLVHAMCWCLPLFCSSAAGLPCEIAWNAALTLPS